MGFDDVQLRLWHNGSFVLSHKVKLIVPLTSAEASLPEGQLHLQRKLHAPQGALS